METLVRRKKLDNYAIQDGQAKELKSNNLPAVA